MSFNEGNWKPACRYESNQNSDYHFMYSLVWMTPWLLALRLLVMENMVYVFILFIYVVSISPLAPNLLKLMAFFVNFNSNISDRSENTDSAE